MKPNWESKEETDVLDQPVETKAIILYNDPINSFDHVIQCLQKYCEHGYEQAGQIALIVHTKGKTDIKHGSYEELLPIHQALSENKLITKIEN